MSDLENIFDQIKTASENAETKDFAAMDKVWNRVEEKLDAKVLTKQNSVLKKVAIAASFLLFISVLYQLLKSEPDVKIPKTNSVTKTLNKDKNEISTSEKVITTIKNTKEKEIISEEQIFKKEEKITSSEAVVTNNLIQGNQTKEILSPTEKPVKNDSRWLGKNAYEARSVEHQDYEVLIDAPKTVEAKAAKKEDPLLVIDDKVRKGGYGSLDEDEIESIVELKEPLYIINSVQYSEEEMFGENATSPYAPLSKQNIESISIVQDEKAIAMYGKKGKNGVVIIHTKDAKPAAKKGK
jgi:TonB-dependent SusC/RagA subfamily outer membrane receptor